MSIPESITCFLVEKQGEQIQRGIQVKPLSALPDGEVLIQIHYSALNYKDGLAADGHPGVALSLPLVPGIDGVGTVIQSSSDRCSAGDQVMITGADFGTRAWGGWSTCARVPGSYCIPIPQGMSMREAVIIGTAGFTAAQSVEKLQHDGVQPGDGPVVVSGATGGVGVFAVRLLAQLGYEVVAVTGKMDRKDWLMEQGAHTVRSRDALQDESGRPLLKGEFAGGIDCVGGRPLDTMLRSTKPGGCVTACGLVAGAELNMTVYPFILRGVSLQGIDSANASVAYRERLWGRLATDWKMEGLESLVTEVALQDVESSVVSILAGKVFGRHVVSVESS